MPPADEDEQPPHNKERGAGVVAVSISLKDGRPAGDGARVFWPNTGGVIGAEPNLALWRRTTTPMQQSEGQTELSGLPADQLRSQSLAIAPSREYQLRLSVKPKLAPPNERLKNWLCVPFLGRVARVTQTFDLDVDID
jgi:hypothetical protein